jgi:hypothetical protein
MSQAWECHLWIESIQVILKNFEQIENNIVLLGPGPFLFFPNWLTHTPFSVVPGPSIHAISYRMSPNCSRLCHVRVAAGAEPPPSVVATRAPTSFFPIWCCRAGHPLPFPPPPRIGSSHTQLSLSPLLPQPTSSDSPVRRAPTSTKPSTENAPSPSYRWKHLTVGAPSCTANFKFSPIVVNSTAVQFPLN